MGSIPPDGTSVIPRIMAGVKGIFAGCEKAVALSRDLRPVQLFGGQVRLPLTLLAALGCYDRAATLWQRIVT